MADITRVIIVGKNVREAEGYWRAHLDNEYAGLTVKAMSVEAAGTQLDGLGRGTRVDVMSGAATHKLFPKLNDVLRRLVPKGVEVRWCPSGSR